MEWLVSRPITQVKEICFIKLRGGLKPPPPAGERWLLRWANEIAPHMRDAHPAVLVEVLVSLVSLQARVCSCIPVVKK